MRTWNYLDIEVALAGVRPKIWRRFLLHDRATFAQLHDAIQDACGWEHAHLFVFRNRKGEAVAGRPDEYGWGDPDPDAGKISAAAYLKRRGKVAYEYDFGDSWEHDVELKQVVTLEDRFMRRLLGGARAFPPEDCGGLAGYEDAVAVVSGGAATVHDTEELRAWLGDWTPERFDPDALRQFFDAE